MMHKIVAEQFATVIPEGFALKDYRNALTRLYENYTKYFAVASAQGLADGNVSLCDMDFITSLMQRYDEANNLWTKEGRNIVEA